MALDPEGRLFGGVLAVAAIDESPVGVIDFFQQKGVRSIDLLLPALTQVAAPYAGVGAAKGYLREAYSHWIRLDDPTFTVRYLKDFTLGVLGKSSSLDTLGGDLSGLLVVESDGSLQLLDVLLICDQTAAWKGAHLATHSLASFVSLAEQSLPAACAKCRTCPAFQAYGGGYLPHRWDGLTFDNPSVHCHALF